MIIKQNYYYLKPRLLLCIPSRILSFKVKQFFTVKDERMEKWSKFSEFKRTNKQKTCFSPTMDRYILLCKKERFANCSPVHILN